MTVFQSIKKTSATQKLSHLQEAFIKRIVLMLIGYSEGWIVFDQHKEKSLKNKTRQKRSTTSTEYQVYPQMKLTISIKDLLSSSKTKSYLTTMFAGALLEHFWKVGNLNLIVTYGTTIKGNTFEEQHAHEDADTLIPHQVLASIAEMITKKYVCSHQTLMCWFCS